MVPFKLLLIAGFFLLSSVVSAEMIDVHIRGLVCGLCAQGLQKDFAKQESVKSVKISLKTKTMSLDIKEDKTLDDETIRMIVKDAGFDVEKIERKS